MPAVFTLRRDVTVAGLLALLLATGWAWRGDILVVLQAMLLIGVVLAIDRPASAGPSVIAGLLVAASLMVSPATLPLLAGLAAVAVVQWMQARPGAKERLHGIGVGIVVGLAAARGLSTAMATARPI